MAEVPRPEEDLPVPRGRARNAARPRDAGYSYRDLRAMMRRRRRFLLAAVAVPLLLCVAYCLIVPNQFEAQARVALRVQPVSSLTVEAAETLAPASILSTPLQLETLVNMVRSEQLAWRVITGLRLYESSAFVRNFAGRFPGFDAARPTPMAQGYLLDRFEKRLQVRALPRTLLIEIRFRSKDAALAAAVVNELVRGYMALESEARVESTAQGSAWLKGQLQELMAQAAAKEKDLAAFERAHGFTTTQQTVTGGQPVETLHDANALQIEEIGRLLAAASGDRIVRESLYREAEAGSPEQVLAANPDLQAEMGPGGATILQQLHTRSSELGVQLAEMQAEHGPKFPRVV